MKQIIFNEVLGFDKELYKKDVNDGVFCIGIRYFSPYAGVYLKRKQDDFWLFIEFSEKVKEAINKEDWDYFDDLFYNSLYNLYFSLGYFLHCKNKKETI